MDAMKKVGRITAEGLITKHPELDIDGNEVTRPYSVIAGVPGREGFFVVGSVTAEKLYKVTELLNPEHGAPLPEEEEEIPFADEEPDDGQEEDFPL